MLAEFAADELDQFIKGTHAVTSHKSLLKKVGDFRLTPFRLSDRSLLLARTYCLLGMALSISGCITTQPVPEKVYVRVPVACIEKMPDSPAFLTDGAMAKMDDFTLIIEMRADPLNQRQHINELRAILTACAR